jgi:putative ABC transport system permease protein
MVIFEGLRPTLLGVFIGIAGAFALARVMSNLIYGVKPTDPLTFVSVAFLLGVVALGASIIPAYRAAKVDPLVALRYE